MSMNAQSRLQEILSKGEFAVTAECGPPRGATPEVVRKKGELLKRYVDAVNVTDNQTAIVRMSSIAACSPGIGTGLHCNQILWAPTLWALAIFFVFREIIRASAASPML